MRPDSPVEAQDWKNDSEGYQQVLSMLKEAEPYFVEALLKRLKKRDPDLAKALSNDLLTNPRVVTGPMR